MRAASMVMKPSRGDVLHGPEQRLRERIVVGDAGPAKRRDHAKPLHRREHGRALHRAAVVGDPTDEVDIGTGLVADALDQSAGQVGRLDVVDLPAEDLPAPHVHDQVQVAERAAHVALEIRDVPRRPATVRWRRARSAGGSVHTLGSGGAACPRRAAPGRSSTPIRCTGRGRPRSAPSAWATRRGSALVAVAMMPPGQDRDGGQAVSVMRQLPWHRGI